MDINFHIDYEFAFRLLLSFLIGVVIGFEREYRSKAAGLRTMIMICLGSTVFTEISISMDVSDRILSNIVTGIGFLGAGVIFRDGVNVSGLTTATTIWICAALGIAVGVGEYFVALVSSVIVLFVLSVLERFQQFIEQLHQVRTYKITVRPLVSFQQAFEFKVKRLNLHARKRKDLKNDNSFMLFYDVSGKEDKLEKLNVFLKNESQVITYEY